MIFFFFFVFFLLLLLSLLIINYWLLFLRGKKKQIIFINTKTDLPISDTLNSLKKKKILCFQRLSVTEHGNVLLIFSITHDKHMSQNSDFGLFPKLMARRNLGLNNNF